MIFWIRKNRASEDNSYKSPRNILELILVVTLFLIYYVNYTGTDKKELLGLLGIFALEG